MFYSKNYSKKEKKQTIEAEQILWEQLRSNQLGIKFRRQHIIDTFIVDFVCISKKLIIEVDGKYHNNLQQKEVDELRTLILNELGYKVIRFSNQQVIGGIDAVINTIKATSDSLPLGRLEGLFHHIF